jgi:hypothetical protein
VEEKDKLVAGPTWWPDTQADWPTDRRWQEKFVRFEIITSMAMKNAVFWDVIPCGSYKIRRFGRT